MSYKIQSDNKCRRVDIKDLEQIKDSLYMGEMILLSGMVFTARDAAHKRIISQLLKGCPPPFALKGAVIYYAGPTPGKDGMPVGSCGPTTSGRMDVYTPPLLDLGLAAVIGKGERNKAVINSIIKNKSVYFCAIGGAGALAAKCIKSCKEIAFADLGCESIKQMQIKDFPVIVALDCCGRNIFERDAK